MRSILIATSFLGFIVQSAGAYAADDVKDRVPSEPEQRTWYPRTDEYFPERLVASWVFYKNGDTLEFLTTPAEDHKPKPTLLGSIRAYTREVKSGREGSAGIPVFAKVTLKESEIQALTIDDIAEVSVPKGAAELFCGVWGRKNHWKFLRYARPWKEGDEVRYINSALLSHVAWKIGKQHEGEGKLALGDYFSAGGGQYDQTSTSGTLPAVSIFTTMKVITAEDLAGTSCSSSSRMAVPVSAQLTSAPLTLKHVVIDGKID